MRRTVYEVDEKLFTNLSLRAFFLDQWLNITNFRNVRLIQEVRLNQTCAFVKEYGAGLLNLGCGALIGPNLRRRGGAILQPPQPTAFLFLDLLENTSVCFSPSRMSCLAELRKISRIASRLPGFNWLMDWEAEYDSYFRKPFRPSQIVETTTRFFFL